jgi:DNA-binding response OmpR family regulator
MDGKKYNLLIVEDDTLSLKFYRLFLSRFFELTLAETVEEFYKAVNLDVKFDAVLMDISLRDEKDGLQLTSELRANEKYKNCPILALTANIFVQDEMAAYEAGITKFLRKPIDNHLLLHELHAAIIESLK